MSLTLGYPNFFRYRFRYLFTGSGITPKNEKFPGIPWYRYQIPGAQGHLVHRIKMFSLNLLKNSNQHFRPLSWWRWVGSKTCEGAANLIWHSFQFMSFGFLRDRWFYKQLRQIRPWAAEGCLSSICSKSNLEWKRSKISAAFFAHTTLPLSLPPLKCDILTRSFSSLDACNVFFHHFPSL